MNVIPAIDLRGGRCVRLYQGDFERETVYDSSPHELAREYRASGFDMLHVVDLDGAKEGRAQNQETVWRILENDRLSVQLGGGIRSEQDIRYWLDAGVGRVVIGSLALTDAEALHNSVSDCGPERVVLALDVRLDPTGVPRVATHGWTRMSEQSLWDCIEEFLPSGLRYVLCTDISRDGAMSGPNIALYRELVEKYPELRIQASGGVRNKDDIAMLQGTGVWGAITGRALLDGSIKAEEISSFLPAA